MKNVSHEQQQWAWDAEHKKPQVLKQMDSDDASGGVTKSFDFLKSQNISRDSGVEMRCGKGRNVIWLAKQGVKMVGFDFSPAAIEEAKKRAEAAIVTSAHFLVADATKKWPFESEWFDFGIDCFASTDIESLERRRYAISEMRRVLKPEGYVLAYLLSVDDEFHKEMIANSAVSERNAFVHPTGKFEKTYDEQDIIDVFKDFEVVRKKRVPKKALFGDKEYGCNHFWLVFRKPR